MQFMPIKFLSYLKLHSPESEQNVVLFRRMVEELHHEFGGQENCPWPPVMLKGRVNE
jgi:hypothetical protein